MSINSAMMTVGHLCKATIGCPGEFLCVFWVACRMRRQMASPMSSH